jgi:glycosyltransferase involved in cell wall biosynthesis
MVEESLRDQARRLDVADRLHLIDPVPHYEVTGVVAGATVSLILIQNICLSYYFCFPNKLLESLLGGLPVMVSRLVELERVVGETGAGLVVDETDPKAIADGIRSIVDNREDYVPDSETIDFIRCKYGWDVQKQGLLELYDELAPGASKAFEFAEAAVDRKDPAQAVDALTVYSKRKALKPLS